MSHIFVVRTTPGGHSWTAARRSQPKKKKSPELDPPFSSPLPLPTRPASFPLFFPSSFFLFLKAKGRKEFYGPKVKERGKGGEERRRERSGVVQREEEEEENLGVSATMLGKLSLGRCIAQTCEFTLFLSLFL